MVDVLKHLFFVSSGCGNTARTGVLEAGAGRRLAAGVWAPGLAAAAPR